MLFKQLYYISFGLATAFIVLGILLNDHGEKYSFSKRRDASCSRGYVLSLSVPDSHMCCDDSHHGTEWVCMAAFDKLSRFLASSWAWLLPFTPVAITLVLDVAMILLFKRPYSTQKVDTDSLDSSWTSLVRSSLQTLNLQRLPVYVGIVLIRTFLLYLLPETLMEYLYSNRFIPMSSSCWCPEFVSSKKCELRFDFSDHIVLFMIQYVLIVTIELAYILYNRVDTDLPSGGKPLIGSLRLFYYLPVVVCCAFILVCIRAVFLTALFFHTPLESVVGLTMALASSWIIIRNMKLSRSWSVLSR